MLPKPKSCLGCPLYQSGKGFVPDEVVEGAEVFVLAQNPGANEVQGKRVIGWDGKHALTEPCTPRPLIGQSGWDMERVFLPLAGLERGKVSLGNVFRCRVGETNDLPKPSVLHEAAQHCERAHLRIPDSTKLIVAVGAEAWKHTQQRHDLSVYDWRGHLGPARFGGVPVYATLHFADLLPNRDPRMTLPTKMDWAKIPAVLKGEHPKPLPPCLIVGEVPLTHILAWFAEAERVGSMIAWDTEFLYDSEDMWKATNYQLTMVSVAVPEMEAGVQLLYHGGHAKPYEKAEFIKRFWRLVTTKPSIFHNAKAEARSTHKTWGWDVRKVLWNFEDTMLAHAARWSEWPHGLDFVESLYSPYSKIKHLPTTDPVRNWGDTCITLEAWKKLKMELANDPDSERVYRQQSLRLVVPTLERDMRGIAVNQAEVAPLLEKFERKVHDANQIVQSAVGWPINLNSPAQLKEWLDSLGVTVKKGKKSKSKTLNKDAVAELRQSICPFDAEWEQEHGVDTEYVLQRIDEGADPVLECRAFFVRAEKLAANYLRPLVEEV